MMSFIDITFITEYVEVQSQMPRKDTSEGDEDFYETIMAEMEDAMSTSYIHGRWVTTSMTDGYVNEILKNKLYAHICIHRGGGPGGAWGGRAPPRIQDLCSKFFENCQNLIFPIIRAPPPPLSKNCCPAPVLQ